MNSETLRDILHPHCYMRALLIFSWSDTCWERRIMKGWSFWFCYENAEISKELLSVTEEQSRGEEAVM